MPKPTFVFVTRSASVFLCLTSSLELPSRLSLSSSLCCLVLSISLNFCLRSPTNRSTYLPELLTSCRWWSLPVVRAEIRAPVLLKNDEKNPYKMKAFELLDAQGSMFRFGVCVNFFENRHLIAASTSFSVISPASEGTSASRPLPPLLSDARSGN